MQQLSEILYLVVPGMVVLYLVMTGMFSHREYMYMVLAL